MRESRIRLSTGTLPSPQLERLATSRPFVQQIDVVLPSRVIQDEVFTSLKTTYLTAQFTLSELYEHALRITTSDVPFKAIPLPVQRGADDDTWCIDPRGVLTLCVSKTLYEQLGLVGQKLPFKGCPDRYVIRIPLKQETTSVAVRARQRGALDIWDRVRAGEGFGRWRVAYVGPLTSGENLEAYTTTDVSAHVRRDMDVYVPHINDSGLVQSTEETAEDHQERLEALFEWVGMASVGAQRLRANDRVDPYVAVYEPPSPASIGDLTHICWKGFLDGAFVRSVIDTAMSILPTSQSSGDNPFISVALHSQLGTPVSYVPESLTKDAPLRMPGPDAEDTMCVILSKASSTKSTWAMAESIGKWDARWG